MQHSTNAVTKRVQKIQSRRIWSQITGKNTMMRITRKYTATKKHSSHMPNS